MGMIPETAFLRGIRQRQHALRGVLRVEDGGATAYTGRLSAGCRCCKEGTWFWLWAGYRCNLRCAYCKRPNSGRRDRPDAFQHLPLADAQAYVRLGAGGFIKGVSYSGGEPLLYLDKICPFAASVACRHPGVYQWIYTNGILADRDRLARLADSGISEIRFHLLASGFSPAVMKNFALARRFFPKLTAELPSLPAAHASLLKDRLLNALEDAGTDHLNLAEAFLAPGNEHAFQGLPLYRRRRRGAGQPFLSPTVSRHITYDIIEYAVQRGLRLAINDCSNQAKALQLRRKTANRLLRRI